VVAITEDDVRELALRKPTIAPVTSCYLNVDGRRRLRHQDVTHALDLLLRPARAGANGEASVAQDLQRIEDHVGQGFERSHVAGLAMFSCSADGFWKVFALAVPVRDQVVVNHSPSVRQLETVLDEYERFGVLLADRQRARMLVFELGELVESSEEHVRVRFPSREVTVTRSVAETVSVVADPSPPPRTALPEQLVLAKDRYGR